MVVLAVIAVVTFSQLGKTRARHRRDAMYESVLTSYQGAFPSGTSREHVETYLASKTLHFERRCLAIPEHTACDIVEIGTEPSPWYCSRSVVCLEFHFSTGTSDALRSDSSDRLENIALARKLEDCL